MGRSGLLPLEPAECLLDSPYFREKLHVYEKELENTSASIKGLTKDVKDLLDAAKHLSRCQRTFATSLEKFRFSYIGGAQTDDEIVISGSLKEFGRLINLIEEERQHVLEHGYTQIIGTLDNFRRQHIGGAKDGRKKFEKQTQKFCSALERYLNLSTKKLEDHTLREADALLEQEQRQFDQASLDYVCLLQEVQQRKKFEFVETLLSFMYGWLTFYHQGHELAKDSERSMTDLQARLQKTRDEFNATRTEVESLKNRTLEVRHTKSLDVGSMDKMYTRQGYLYLMEKKAFGTTWTKHYCMYDKKSRHFTLIPYNQITGKLISTDLMVLKSCVRRKSETIDRRFCFDVTAEEREGQVYTLQALNEDDRRLWLDAMDGREPTYARFDQERRQDQTSLDSAGLLFVSRCLAQLEQRGLQDQGLYRVVGVSSKVNRLVQLGLSRTKFEQVDLESPQDWENKTITSAVKTYLRNLPEPLMTFNLHSEFINAAKTDKKEARVAKVRNLVNKLPKLNHQLLELLIHHLQKVSDKSERNLMSVSNLAVCFGPTLLRPEEDTMAAIIDIKFCNTVVETLVYNYNAIFCGGTDDREAESNGRPVANGPPAGRQPPVKPVLSASARLGPRSIHPSLEHAAPPSTPQLDQADRSLLPARRADRSSSPEVGRPARLASSPPDLGRAARTVRLGGRTGAVRRHQSGSAAPEGAASGGRQRHNHVSSTLVTNELELSERASPSNNSMSSSTESLSSRSSRDHQQAGSSTSSPYARGKLRVRCPPSYRSQPDLSVSVPVSSGSASTPVPPSQHRVGRVRTLYACVGENESELSFEPNQIITNVRPSREPGWLEGTLNGQLGLLPDNYVEFLP